MASNQPPPPQSPLSTIEKAFDRFEQTVSSSDARAFHSTELKDVWKAAEDIQSLQRDRRSLRNMNRIRPLLDILEKYSRTIEVLCNGTPYLPWVWAPIKLMLQLASGYTNIFDQLIDGYAQIAEAMPHFDRLHNTFKDDPNFQAVLALVYTDILDFHQRAYKFFRRRSWHIGFDSLWKSFETRFNSILKNLARHKELVTKEAIAIDIVEARQWRARAREDMEYREKRRLETHFHDIKAWLNVAQEHQDDELDRLLGKRQVGTCDWIFKNAQMISWKDEAHGDPFLWVKGIPGAGKTILCTYIVHCIQDESQISAAYYICNSYTNGKNLLGEMMRSLALQLLRNNLDLLTPYVFDNYANKGFPPSVSHLRRLLPELLLQIPAARICVDGLDEYPENEQRPILQELLSLAKTPGGHCRVLLSSRDVTQISKALRNKSTISFRDEQAGVDKDIQAYVQNEMADLRERFNEKLVDNIQDKVVEKANGMFLWVRLVLLEIKECDNAEELKSSADMLPNGLDQAYGRILDRVMNELGTRQSLKAIRILEWLACSFRTLKAHEVQDGIAFHTESTVMDDGTKLPSDIVDLCKPLIEDGPNNNVDFVHYSAKEYILHRASGPFLKKVKAHYDIAFSCITYLNSTFCFRDPSISEGTLRLRVAKAFHGLHHYANEFWFQHLLQYAKCLIHLDDREMMELEREDDLIEVALEKLVGFWKAAPGDAAKSLKLDDTTTAEDVKSQVSALNDRPWVERMGLDVQMFRAHLTQEKYAHQTPDGKFALQSHELKYDPTYFSDTSQRYQAIVAFLLECPLDQLPQGVTPKILDDFRQTYSHSAFVCRYRECPRHSDGFKSSAKRDEHESSHAKPLRCADSSCEFFARGFSSKNGLLKHNRKYHPKPEEKELPKFEPRKEPPAAPYVPPPPEVPPPRPATPKPVEVIREPRREKPVKKRVSRAKRGFRVHNCEVCPKVFTRAEGLRRHELSHQKPAFHCTYDECERAFHRPDLLERHLKRHEICDDTQRVTRPTSSQNQNQLLQIPDSDVLASETLLSLGAPQA